MFKMKKICSLAVLLSVFISTAIFAADKKTVGVIKIASHAALDADEKGFEAAMAASGFKGDQNTHLTPWCAFATVDVCEYVGRNSLQTLLPR
jgi:ABC-type uncharacterized transport system substrate-binding protein